VPLVFAQVEVDVCHRCGGVWLDTGELEAILTRGGTPAGDPVLRLLSGAGRRVDAGALCPRCDARMIEVRTSDLVADRCPDGHGLWFDGGELERLLREPCAGAAVILADVLGRRSSVC
jgi:Zn-finger nucleic acid-binding protein